jgi:tripartite-type tricarboxylate transporter receptor subunit TctC
MSVLRRAVLQFIGCLVLFTSVAPVAAQEWPDRPVRLIVPFPAGSATDLVARIIAAEVSASIGQPVVNENVGGAGGTIGVRRAARAAPDGYTMVLGAVDTFAQSQYLFQSPPYDSVRDFDAVALVVQQPLVMIVRKDLPASNLQEFARYARVHAENLTFGSAGVGAAPYLACAMLNSAIGARGVVHVPYRAAAPAFQDMIMGRLDYYCPLAISVGSLIQDQSVKMLAILTPERSVLFPDLPTAREQGVDVADGYYWNAFFAPRGTPEPIVAMLNAAIHKALDQPSVQARLRTTAATVVPPEQRSSAYLREYLQSEIAKWTAIMRTAGVPQQ